MAKGKTIFRGGAVSEGVISGKNEIELINGNSDISVGKNYLSDTTFNIGLQSGSEMVFKIENTLKLIGNTYTFYVNESPGQLTGASITFRPSVGSSFFGLASCSDGNLKIRNSSEIIVNEARYLTGCLITIRLINANQISINIISPDESSKISVS
tara:strand:+ start:2079 stop:2543 length:465 start_codon:yes stop_codon:yes gene_type:complete